MNKQNLYSKIMFGFTLLVGLLPLSCTFSQNGTELLFETQFKYLVWLLQTINLLLLLLKRDNMSKNQIIGLSIIYLLVPITFTFSTNGITFLILNNYLSSILSWAIASVLFSKLFKNTNFTPNY